MTVINVLATPSNSIYGFDGVSDEEFNVYCENIDKIINLTSMGYDEEFSPDTDSSLYLYSDSDDYGYHHGIGGIEFETINEEDLINDISDKFYNEICCGFDLFNPLSPEDLKEAAKTVQSWIED